MLTLFFPTPSFLLREVTVPSLDQSSRPPSLPMKSKLGSLFLGCPLIPMIIPLSPSSSRLWTRTLSPSFFPGFLAPYFGTSPSPFLPSSLYDTLFSLEITLLLSLRLGIQLPPRRSLQFSLRPPLLFSYLGSQTEWTGCFPCPFPWFTAKS